jgi:chromosome segregation ATPase
MLDLMCEAVPADPAAFRRFLEHQTALFVESLQEAATDQWDHICDQCDDHGDALAEMRSWWSGQTSRFRESLRAEHRRLVRRKLRRLGRATELIQSLRSEVAERGRQIESLEVQIEELRADKQIDRELIRRLEDEALCRDCYGRRYSDW